MGAAFFFLLLCSDAGAQDQTRRVPLFPKWQDMLQRAENEPLKPLLDQVHKSLRRYAYVSDQVNYGLLDYWATPREFTALLSGDCEDFAIKWYFQLIGMGVPENWIHIVVVYQPDGQIHAIVQVKDWWLDQQAARVMPLASLRRYYTPIFSLNRLEWCVGGVCREF